ncbi:MAG: GNAT family N-acetyltransferase [Lachnospiraceae bacterium]
MDIILANNDSEVEAIADLAAIIWHEHFISILSMEQIDYMVEKFQSYRALKEQISEGYEYYQLKVDGELVGYAGIHEVEDALFLSKLYIRKDCRGQNLSSQAFAFLKNLCKERSLRKIWLTCNKYNSHTLDVYKHFGFETVNTQEADIGNGFIMDDFIMEYIV